MRDNISFKEFMELSEAGSLPPEQVQASNRLKTALRGSVSKAVKGGNAAEVIDKTVMRVAINSKNPIAVGQLADKAKKGRVI